MLLNHKIRNEEELLGYHQLLEEVDLELIDQLLGQVKRSNCQKHKRNLKLSDRLRKDLCKKIKVSNKKSLKHQCFLLVYHHQKEEFRESQGFEKLNTVS